MEFNLKKIIYLILIIILIVALVVIIPKVSKKKDTKKENTKTEEVQPDTNDNEVSDTDIEVPSDGKNESKNENKNENKGTGEPRQVRCEKEDYAINIVYEKQYVIFDIDGNNKVQRREDVREYKFEKVDTDEYVSNKQLSQLSKSLDSVTGITSKFETVNKKDKIYRFTTIFEFDKVVLDELYEKYYHVYFPDEIAREDFDKRYKSLDYDEMVFAYLQDDYVCK